MDLNESHDVDRLIDAGHALEDAGNFEAALARYNEAIAAAPGDYRGHMNAANALQRLGRRDEALTAQRRAVERAPDNARARFNLGALLLARGEMVDAEAQLLRASELEPGMAEAAVLLADLYERAARFDEAEAQFARALSLAPQHAGIIRNFGMFCLRLGRSDEALRLVLRASALDPEDSSIPGGLAFALNLATDLDAAEIADKHRQLGAQIERSAGPAFTTWPNDVDWARRLRIGYVSGDFFIHPVALFLRPVLEHHDPQAVETFCYSSYPSDNDMARLLRRYTHNWRDISTLRDAEVVAQVRRDRIDILVDLSGHTDRNRLSVFACHPAPVQATWLGYLNTTGLPAMDYRICDRYTDPEGATEHLHTECLVRMPHSQWCYAPWPGVEQVVRPVPRRHDRVAFGSFNQVAKISDTCLRLWCEVLSRSPDSTLLVLDVRQPDIGKALLGRIERFGIDPARIDLRGRQSMVDYFAAIGSVDVALDTFPYNGATTTLDTLWMGTPVVALRGARGIARGCYSILATLGANELIARDEAAYVDINATLADDYELRQRLRRTLPQRLAASPLMDAVGFTTELESAYRNMWHAWCADPRTGANSST